jgi:hypothetical protein
MPGYAFPVGATTAEYPSQTINTPASLTGEAWEDEVGIILGGELNPITTKVRVNSVYLNNLSGGILPVQLVRGQAQNMTEYDIVHSTRVLKTKFMIFPMVTGDSRSDDITATETMLNEIVLAPGDFLAVMCPFEDAIIATTNISIGVK